MSIPHLPDYIPDHDDPDSADDMFLPGVVSFRMERMDNHAYWIGLTLADGTQVNIDVGAFTKRTKRVKAYVRERTK